eukprot:TRINITY_DN464_c0_g2_i9.p1 TRINITY_DN464_c0_g2~~TRINITY_DN464_c0_g2_i9.p1  ORF type:complete len:504 (+),score=118.46 TRINITY_DN464_c0_g2_i9:54-1514(+)
MFRTAFVPLMMLLTATVSQAEVTSIRIDVSMSIPLQTLMEQTVGINTGIGKLIFDELGLGDESRLRCHLIIRDDGNPTNYADCGEVVGDYPPEAQEYKVVYLGDTNKVLTDVESAISDTVVPAFADVATSISVEVVPFNEHDPAPVYLHIRVDSSLKDIMDYEDQLVNLLREQNCDGADIVYICDEANTCMRRSELPDPLPEEKKNYRISLDTYCPLIVFDDNEKILKEAISQFPTPLEEMFGMGNVYPSWYSFGFPLIQTPLPANPVTDEPAAIPDTLAPTPAPSSPTPQPHPATQEQRVGVNFGITIEFDTLVASSPSLTTKTQAALEGSEGGAACVSICGTEQTGTVFTPTAECYSCSGASLAKRAARTAEVKRWILTIVGTAPISKQTFVEDIDAALRDYVLQIGGSLDTIEVDAEGIPIHPNGSDSDDGLAAGAIAGIVVGGVVFVAIVVAVSYWLCSRNREADDQQDNEMAEGKPAPDSV